MVKISTSKNHIVFNPKRSMQQLKLGIYLEWSIQDQFRHYDDVLLKILHKKPQQSQEMDSECSSHHTSKFSQYSVWKWYIIAIIFKKLLEMKSSHLKPSLPWFSSSKTPQFEPKNHWKRTPKEQVINTSKFTQELGPKINLHGN